MERRVYCCEDGNAMTAWLGRGAQKEREQKGQLQQQLIKALEQEADGRAKLAQLRQQMANQAKRVPGALAPLTGTLPRAAAGAGPGMSAKRSSSFPTCRELERRLEDLKEAEDLSRIMRDELRRLPLVEKELAKLQEEVELHRRARTNVHLVQERLLAAQSNAAKLTELQKRCSQLQEEAEQLRGELDQWKELATQLGNPTAVLQCLADLRQSELALTERQSKLLAENGTLRTKAESNSQELRRANAKLVKMQTQFDEQTALLRKIQRRLLLLGKKEAGADWPAAAGKQIQLLENVLNDYRHTLEQADKELDGLRSRMPSESGFANAEVQTDSVEFASNESVLEEFGCSKDVTAQVQLKLDQDGALPDRKSLQEQLASAEAKNRRLVDAFRRTSHDFRHGCYALTGYRIDVLSQGHYKLTHMYADSPDDHLLFQAREPLFHCAGCRRAVSDEEKDAEEGDGCWACFPCAWLPFFDIGHNAEQKMNVLETDYLRSLEDLASTYLEKYDSIPAFLSALTLQLFRQQNDLDDTKL
ncbi:hypothetical protein HPB48_020595 [Haemaphysalis longicornis]|uniref:Mitotic spindle assembly checkpoint protein MAD1 n=1 Tax=Haemaphysalis longicornis TaxID=44386 RepID=A0A9J6FRY9_HAELO|nr:hypothetical protein HPB48_020595 [Haemaphysalis longicornis]